MQALHFHHILLHLLAVHPAYCNTNQMVCRKQPGLRYFHTTIHCSNIRIKPIDVCGQSPAAYLGGEHIAKTVVGEAVGLTFPIVGSLDGGQVSLVISILHGSGICNDYNQKKCPGKTRALRAKV